MGLRKKTFLYSIVLAVIMIVFVIGYFVLMLPSLYVDYVMDSNLESVTEIQQGYMKERNYDNLTVKNPSSVFTMEVPNAGNQVYFAGKFFKLTITVQDEDLQTLLDRTRKMMGDAGDLEQIENADDFWDVDSEEFKKFSEQWQDKCREIFEKQSLFSEDAPIAVSMEKNGQKDSQVYRDEYYKLHIGAGNTVVYEGGVSDGNYSYTTYVAMGRTQDALIITVLPTMTPQMEEITPIVMGSLPMIIAVIFLVVLISSNFFSGKIVNPIIRLANHAESMELDQHFETDELIPVSEGGDEIAALGRSLRELYGKLRENYEELEHKNSLLEEENERQEVFLRASSHQLKTPIAAALLLVEGMINEVGKYQDTKAYLPEVKKQLLSMRKMAEDILCLNYHANELTREEVAVEALVREVAGGYAVQIEDKGLQIVITGSAAIYADGEILKKIIDNLFSNAVSYTPENQSIAVEIDETAFRMINYGVTIDESLLPNVKEPFVSSDGGGKGKGLGLYVAAWYAGLMGYELTVDNRENGVCAVLSFQKG